MRLLVPFLFLVFVAVSRGSSDKKAVSVTSATINGVSTKAGTFAPGDLIWEDNFDSFDGTKWLHEANMWGGGNNEFQIYDRDPNNTYVKDGVFHIKPTWTLYKLGENWEHLYNGYYWVECCTQAPRGGDNLPACDRQANYPNILHPATSGRVRTKGRFSFRYGKAEIRAKLPSSDWTWPAMWLLPSQEIYGGWPRSGEIDIMESRGNRELFDEDNLNIGTEHIGSTLHFGPTWDNNAWWAAHGSVNTLPTQGFDREFHLYTMEWTPTGFRFSVDSREIVSVNPPPGGFWEMGRFNQSIENPWENAQNKVMAPFDEEFHFMLNVAVGGNFFPANTRPPRPWTQGGSNFLQFWDARDDWTPTWEGDDAALQVDYVRVYAV